ncbi:MAG: GTP pyrophosphokinase family protein [Clostridia bacterium]|nr:GTP pyrophosphokinase family protein [Clostridia bacterium]
MNDSQDPSIHISPEMMKPFISEMQIYRAALKEVKTKLENLDDNFHVHYDYNPIHHIDTRLKSPVSIVNKLRKKEKEVTMDNMREYINDIAGVRVICNYLEDLDRIADILLSQDDVTLIRKKEFHKIQTPNGYRSLHLVVSIPVYLAAERRDVKVEIQIRTIAMDLWASLEHELRYKNKSNAEVPQELSTRLYLCAQVLKGVDDEMQAIWSEIQKLNENEEN